MSYAQGGLIEATDYNNLVGTSPSSTVNRVNTVWAVGSGSAGYGQTAISNVSSAAIVTATQWATLINTLNSILIHQAGTGSGISAVTSGQTINYLATLTTSITTAYSNRLTFNSNSAVIANHNSLSAYGAWVVTNTSVTQTRGFGATVTFTSADAARYFFNAGGRLKFNCSAANNGVANSRSAAAAALFTNLGGIALFGANTNSGRTGSGGSATVTTSVGYFNLTTANTTVVDVTSTTSNYTTDKAYLMVSTNGTQGSNNDNGTVINFYANISSTSGGGSFDDSINITPTVTIDVSYPEVTNIANTWGAVTVARVGS